MNPWDVLAAWAETVVPDGVNVHSVVAKKIVPPAVVIRPDEPWREPDAFCYDLQHYVAVIVTAPNYPDDGTAMMYAIQNALISDLPEGFDWVSMGGIVVDSTTETDLLASALRLTYRNSAGEDS